MNWPIFQCAIDYLIFSSKAFSRYVAFELFIDYINTKIVIVLLFAEERQNEENASGIVVFNLDKEVSFKMVWFDYIILNTYMYPFSGLKKYEENHVMR